MKKIALLLTFVIIFGTFASCIQPDKSISGDREESFMDNENSGTPNETGKTEKYLTPVSIDKSYVAVGVSPSYPDTYNSELTDGQYASESGNYTDPCWTAFIGSNPVSVTIDLEDQGVNLYRFELSLYNDLGPGIALPNKASVYISDDGENFKYLFSIPSRQRTETSAFKLYNESKEPISARYVKFEMTLYSSHIFLDEVTVYADVPSVSSSVNIKKLIEEAYSQDKYDYYGTLANLSKGKVAAGEKNNISQGCNYLFSRTASEKFPNSNQKLTDGAILGASYQSGNWVGYSGSEPVDITLTLSQSRDDISQFEASFYLNPSLGISLPYYLDVSVSNDNQTFTKVGRVYAPMLDIMTSYNYVLSLPEKIECRYVRFSIPEQERKYVFVEELSVFSYGDVVTQVKNTFYAEKPIEEVTTAKYFSSSDSNYNKRINLIAGKTQKIFSFVPLYEGTEGNSPENSNLLTNGKFAQTASYTDSEFFKFGRGEGRDVVYDLGGTAAVDGFSLSFLRQDNVGINYMNSVAFYLSEDGVNWYSGMVGVMPAENSTQIMRYEYKLDKSYKARFARFSFMVWPNAYCDELEVFGTKNASKATSLSSSGKSATLLGGNGYTTRDIHLGGANDIVLVPNYSAEDEKKGKEKLGYSVDDFMPYAAYLDTDGKILDIMFDGFLFCYTGSALEGNAFYMNANKREVAHQTEKLFEQGRDLAALEQAVGKVKNELGLNNYKAKFYFSLSHPGIGVDFGDINGDGVSDVLDTLEKRVAAVKWAIDDFMTRYNKEDYKNIEFAGFYWVHEGMNSDQEDVELINAVAKICHSLGQELFWIPYYKSQGFLAWREYGFDVACMQPNYVFDTRAPAINVQNCAKMAERLGMCVEMEISGKSLTDPVFYKRYMEYLSGGEKYGYMDQTIHMYYQDIYCYLDACYSKDAKVRLIYDYTYDFIKGKLKTAPEKPNQLNFDAQKNTALEASVNAFSKPYEYILTTSPTHGSVTINPDGSFIYYPQEGYTGEDEFEYVLDNYLGFSAPAKVKISVK